MDGKFRKTGSKFNKFDIFRMDGKFDINWVKGKKMLDIFRVDDNLWIN